MPYVLHISIPKDLAEQTPRDKPSRTNGHEVPADSNELNEISIPLKTVNGRKESHKLGLPICLVLVRVSRFVDAVVDLFVLLTAFVSFSVSFTLLFRQLATELIVGPTKRTNLSSASLKTSGKVVPLHRTGSGSTLPSKATASTKMTTSMPKKSMNTALTSPTTQSVKRMRSPRKSRDEKKRKAESRIHRVRSTPAHSENFAFVLSVLLICVSFA